MQKHKLALTGADGFCGQAIQDHLIKQEYEILKLSRTKSPQAIGHQIPFNLTAPHELASDNLRGIETMIHLAALVHNQSASSEQHHQLNTRATLILFEKCLEAGVRHFIFTSTVAVYGRSAHNKPISLEHRTNPKTPYAQAKLKAEQSLRAQAEGKNIKLTILRLPLVYGRGAPGNFGLLSQLATTPLPLPFKATNNTRSMTSRANLAKFMAYAISNKQALPDHILLTDGSQFSTSQIITAIRSRQNKPPRLFSAPQSLLRTAFKLMGKPSIYQQLFEDLRFESTVNLPSIYPDLINDDPAYDWPSTEIDRGREKQTVQRQP